MPNVYELGVFDEWWCRSTAKRGSARCVRSWERKVGWSGVVREESP
jgi:hypothetical protein